MISGALLEQETTNHVIGAFYEVYNTLGFGFLEHVYRDALEWELVERSRMVQKEVVVPVWYKGAVISTQRVDMLVDDRVLVEIKSTEVLALRAQRQLLNYLACNILPGWPSTAFWPQAPILSPGALE